MHAEVLFNAVHIIAAGHDTTSNTLAFTCLLLASRPELQERVAITGRSQSNLTTQ